MFKQVLLAIALITLAIAADTTHSQDCPNGKTCPMRTPVVKEQAKPIVFSVEHVKPNVNHWTYPGRIEDHLQGPPHFRSQAEIASMTREQQLTLHDKLHQAQAQPKLVIAPRIVDGFASLNHQQFPSLGQAPNGAAPEFIAFGVDAPCNLKRSMSTFRDSNCIPLGLVPPSSNRDATGVPSATRFDDSGGRNGRIHATALVRSSGRPCPRPSDASTNRPRPLRHLLQALRSNR